MSYYINKLVALLFSPIGSSLLLLAISFAVLLHSCLAAETSRRRRIIALIMVAFAFVWLWFWSTNCAVRLVAQPLDDCESVDIADLPQADAVVILGGGMGFNADADAPDMFAAADRVWHGARIFNAGKAKKVNEIKKSRLLPAVSKKGLRPESYIPEIKILRLRRRSRLRSG